MKKSVMVLFVLVVLLMSIPAAGNKEVAVTVPAAPTAGLNASGFPIVAEPVTQMS